MRKLMLSVMVSGVLMAGATSAYAADACQDGEVKIKFSHVTNTDKHPKGIAASLLEKRVNEEMNGKACIEVFPNSTLYNDDQVLEAMLQGDVQLAAQACLSLKNSLRNTVFLTFRLCSLMLMQ